MKIGKGKHGIEQIQMFNNLDNSKNMRRTKSSNVDGDIKALNADRETAF